MCEDTLAGRSCWKTFKCLWITKLKTLHSLWSLHSATQRVLVPMIQQYKAVGVNTPSHLNLHLTLSSLSADGLLNSVCECVVGGREFTPLCLYCWLCQSQTWEHLCYGHTCSMHHLNHSCLTFQQHETFLGADSNRMHARPTSPPSITTTNRDQRKCLPKRKEKDRSNQGQSHGIMVCYAQQAQVFVVFCMLFFFKYVKVCCATWTLP